MNSNKNENVAFVAKEIQDKLNESLAGFIGQPNNDFVTSLMEDEMKKIVAHIDTHIYSTANLDMSTDPNGMRTIPDDQLFYMFKQRFGRDTILHKFINDLGLRSSDAAVSRIVDVINATCQPLYPIDEADEDYEGAIEVKQVSAESQLEFLVEQLNELMIVAKARLIYVDYPETATISIQITMTFDEEEDAKRLQQMEELIMEYKPKGLAEIEVSLTNKVVY